MKPREEDNLPGPCTLTLHPLARPGWIEAAVTYFGPGEWSPGPDITSLKSYTYFSSPTALSLNMHRQSLGEGGPSASQGPEAVLAKDVLWGLRQDPGGVHTLFPVSPHLSGKLGGNWRVRGSVQGARELVADVELQWGS